MPNHIPPRQPKHISTHRPLANLLCILCLCITHLDSTAAEDGKNPHATIRIDSRHTWKPPFGLDRIGQPLTVVVERTTNQQPSGKYWLTGYRNGEKIAQTIPRFESGSLESSPIEFEEWPDEVVLYTTPESGEQPVELTRLPIDIPAFEAEAIAHPETVINPVNLGTILAPADWLLLGRDQTAVLDVAAIAREKDFPGAQLRVWFESAQDVTKVVHFALEKGMKLQLQLKLPDVRFGLDHDVLHVVLTDGEKTELWRKTIPVMIVWSAPHWPEFGAVETRLRYDAPISVRAADGTLSTMDYDTAWDSRLQDVVISLPNGSRFVFWRGASYIPFWAGQYNTGLCYEWAETRPPEGFTDCVEPLMDKELRYSRVQIIESTVARVHVRWSYQSCDFYYKVWGDSATEDYYFYPDGFGTRVLDLKTEEGVKYELSEFIILSPQSAHPFDILPTKPVDFLFTDGEKREITVPFFPNEQGEKVVPRDVPALYRIHLNKKESLDAIYFSPNDTNLPIPFGPFSDKGKIVTPVYWGNHWPLARGRTTTQSIDERFNLSPAHNSVMTWGFDRCPRPIRTAALETLDAQGKPKPMTLTRWTWLIGMTNASDDRLIEWANSYTHPPQLEIQGARLDINAYAPERRAFHLIVEEPTVTVKILPEVRCVNPVFELSDAPDGFLRVSLGERQLGRDEYAWDGATLWLKADMDEAVSLQLTFGDLLH